VDRHADAVARTLSALQGAQRPQKALRVAVVGAGWAGLSAAVTGVELGHDITVFDTAASPGGRARVVERPDGRVDNGQHILIGAYQETLDLLSTVGVDLGETLMRQPLVLVNAQGTGLKLKQHRHLGDVLWALLRHPSWSIRARASLWFHSVRWLRQGFQCPPHTTVQGLCRHLSPQVYADLIEPLCVAALNTPADTASASIFLRVLRDSVFGPPGSCDLLIPRVHLSALLPDPATSWLTSRGAQLLYGTRVHSIENVQDGQTTGPAWRVNGHPFDSVILACSAPEAARLTTSIAPQWAQQTGLIEFEAIATAWVQCEGLRLASPMVMLRSGPAQFAFDHGQLGGPQGQLTLVASAAKAHDALSSQELGAQMVAQASRELLSDTDPPPRLRCVLRDRRATWVASAGLQRPPTQVTSGLYAAGDYVDGPYPSTLEAAVRSGRAAARAVHRNDTR